MPAPALQKSEWLKVRRNYLGGSDAAPVMGRSAFRGPVEVYLSKVEGVVGDETDAMRRGTELEPLVIYLYQVATDHETIFGKFIVSEKYPWMAATLDLGDLTLAHPVQCKTASTWTRDKYGDPARGDYTLPADYVIQTHHEMIVSCTKANCLAVLFASEDGFHALRTLMRVGIDMEIIAREALRLGEFVIFPVERNDKLAKQIIKEEKAFWHDHVLAEVPPIGAALPQRTDIIREPKDAEWALLDASEKDYRKWKLHERRWLDRKGELQQAIGENSGIAIPSGGRVTWKAPAPKTETVVTVDYEGIAKILYLTKQVPDEEWAKLVKEHTTSETTTKQRARVIRVPKGWGRE